MTAAEHSGDARQYRYAMAARMTGETARWQKVWDTVTTSGVVPASPRGTRVQLSLDEWERLLSLKTLAPPEARTALPAPGSDQL